jgi:hypothetical protein
MELTQILPFLRGRGGRRRKARECGIPRDQRFGIRTSRKHNVHVPEAQIICTLYGTVDFYIFMARYVMVLRRARSITTTSGTGSGGPWKSRLLWTLKWLLAKRVPFGPKKVYLRKLLGQSEDIRFYHMCNEVLTYCTQELNKIACKLKNNPKILSRWKIFSGIRMYTVPEMPKGWGKICGNLKSHSLPLAQPKETWHLLETHNPWTLLNIHGHRKQ